ncbi:MAG: hypothetical protein OEM41_09025 [Ignavibacteria bacterium]|nr:hypothetical protein [Ignavibacteria bacterium]
MTDRPDPPDQSRQAPPVRIVSWMGGEHWYIGQTHYLHLEDAISACERRGLEYEIVRDPRHMYRREGD